MLEAAQTLLAAAGQHVQLTHHDQAGERYPREHRDGACGPPGPYPDVVVVSSTALNYHAGMVAVPYTQVPGSAWEGTETVYFDRRDVGPEILDAVHKAVPDGATYGFNHDSGRRAWVRVSKPGDTREVLRAAFASLGRDLPDDPGDD